MRSTASTWRAGRPLIPLGLLLLGGLLAADYRCGALLGTGSADLRLEVRSSRVGITELAADGAAETSVLESVEPTSLVLRLHRDRSDGLDAPPFRICLDALGGEVPCGPGHALASRAQPDGVLRAELRRAALPDAVGEERMLRFASLCGAPAGAELAVDSGCEGAFEDAGYGVFGDDVFQLAFPGLDAAGALRLAGDEAPAGALRLRLPAVLELDGVALALDLELTTGAVQGVTAGGPGGADPIAHPETLGEIAGAPLDPATGAIALAGVAVGPDRVVTLELEATLLPVDPDRSLAAVLAELLPDTDGDGRPDATDEDDDGDGVLDDDDAYGAERDPLGLAAGDPVCLDSDNSEPGECLGRNFETWIARGGGGASAAGPARDGDGDGVDDDLDNCTEVANADQVDFDGDGFGNACDADFDGNGLVGIADFNRLRSQFGRTDSDPGFDRVVDANGDGGIGIPEFNLLRSQFGAAPGPAGPNAPRGVVLDPERYVPLDASGDPIEGELVRADGDGVLPPFEYRPGGSGVGHLGVGLRLRFPTGGRLAGAQGSGPSLGTEIEFTDAIADFGEGFPFQLDEPLELAGGAPRLLSEGPLDLASLAALLDLDPADPFDLVLLDEIEFPALDGLIDTDGSMAFDFSGAALGDEICLLEATFSIEVDAPGVMATLRADGGAGLFPDPPRAPLACDGLTTDDFTLAAVGFGAVFTAGAGGFDLDVESGRLVVNQDGPFQGADQVFGRDVCLPGDGGSPGADLDLGDLAISFAGGSFGLEGSAALSDLGVLVPGVPDLRAALCTATLAFDGLALPELELATGLLEWATPEAVLAATITAQGWALSGHPTGSVTGLGTLDFPASSITVEVGVGYDAGSDLFSFSTGLAEDDTIALGDVAYLLDARFDVDLGTAQPGGTARVTGGLGLFPSGPLSDPPLPEEFELSVAGLDALAVFDAQGIVLTLEGGALQLPPGVFASDDTLCGGSEGPQGPAVIDLAEAQSPLTLSFAPGASPPLSLDGVLGVEHLAVAIDELPELDAALCSATLTFAGAEPPTLSGIGGALRLDRPELLLDATFGADLWRLDGLPSGVLAGTGTALLRGPGATFAVQVVYDEPEQRFRFATDAADLQTLALSDDAVVFDAGLAVDLDTTAPRGTVRVSGSAGLFAKTASAEQLDQFELAVSGLVASASFFGADFDLLLEQGTLRLPGGVFRTDDTLCGGANGPQGDAEIDVATADPPLRLQFRAGDSPPVGVFGSIDFGDLGVAVPDLPALSAALCDATLSFAGSDAPTLTDFQGAFSFVQDDFAVDASFDIETWKLDGLPGGVLSGNGTLTLLETGTVFGVAVLYDEAARRFRFASGAEGLETVALHPDVVLFDVGVALDVSTAAPVGTVALTGSAGLFARTASPASPADFELSVAGFDALASFDAQGFVLTLQGGALQLPPSVFESDGTLCDGAAGVGSPAVVDLSSGTPLTISFDAAASPPVDLAGTIEFREIAVQAPGFPDLRGALCRTDLTFAGLAAPTLADVNGALALDTPDFALTADVTVDAWRLDGLPTGTLAGTGSFELIETGTTVDVAVSYDTGADAFRFATAVGAIPALPFLEDLALFDAGLLLELQRGASEGLVGITGSAGLFLAGARPGPPVPAPGDFLVAVSDLAASLRFDPTGFELRLDGGALALGPAFDAGLLDETTCTGGDGLPEVALGESTQVVATFPVGATPSLALSGQFDFANLGVSLPALPGLGAELCTATLGLDFSLGFPLPALTNVAGAVQLPLPDGNVRVALSGAEFDLLGFPTGRIALVDDLPLFGIEGFELALIGAGGDACDAVPTCLGIDPPVSGTGLAICDVGGVPRFELDGGVRLALPGEVLALESGDSVAIEACGGLAITAGQAPEIAIDALALGGNFRLGGPDGLRISGFDTGQLASVEVSGLDQLFAPNGPLFDVELSGAVEVPGGPRFALDQARFGFARDGAGVLLPPSFSIAAISFAPGDALSLGDVLPLSITEAGIRFSDPAPPGGLPALLDPQNLEFTLSAKAALPSPEAPFIVGQVEDLVASLDAQGFPIFRLDAIRLGIQDLPLGPLNVAGDVLVGGLGVPPEELFESIYFAGTVGGKLNGAGVLVNLAFDMAGVIGACLDVGAGPAGIPLGPSGFLLTGVAGGVAFDPEIVDPCDFTDVFFDGSDPVLDAGAGGGGGGGGAAAAGPRPPARPRAAITWEQLAARNQFGGLERQALARVGPTVGGAAGPSYQPVGGGGGGGAFQCPPQALSVLCELHPDTVAFPDVAIIRFTSLTQAQVDDVLAQVGLSPAQLQTLTPGAVADAIAGGIRDQIDLLFPPAVAMQLGSLYGDALDAIETATGDVLFAAASAALGGGASVYDAIVAAAYAGIPCPTVILKLSGTFSHASVSTVLSLTGAVTVNVGSGAGLGGTVNLVGIPVGDATAFFSLTDAVGDVNPSLCGEVEAALGPIELGRLEALYECQGCSNALFEAAEQFAGCVTAPGADALLLDAVAEVAPDLDLAGLAPPDAVAQLTPEQATAFLGQMFAVPAASLAFDEACFADVVDSLYAAVDPRISLDGAVAPRIFGIPVGESLVAVQMRLDKTALTAGLGFSPSFLIGNVGLCLGTIGVFCSPVFPALDAGTLTATLPLPNAADVLSAGLRGDLASPAAIDAFLADGTNDLLERGLFLLDYRFAPFGLEMAGAEARVVMPNLLEHPGAPASSWVPPELRGDPDLPGRRELLIAALENQVGFENGFLANLDWLGQREDLYLVYPDGSPERDALLDCHPGEAEPGCSVREDYFPYGGLLGAAQLALPAILTETPSPTLFEALDPAGDPFARALAAVDVITNQVLVTGAPLGSLAFYVPGPTPPAFCDEPSPALDPVGLVESLRGFDFDTVLQEVQQQGLLPACEQADAIFPVEEAFFEGYVESRLFGVEFARADLTVSAPDQLLRAEGGTNDVPCIEDDPVDGDWLGCFVDSASLTFEIRAGGDPSCVPGPVETCAPPDFYALLPGLVADLGAGDPGAALAEFETTLIEGLPKVALHASLQGFRLPAPLDQYATASGSVALGAFSPRFDPDFSDDLPDGSPIGDARRHGGIGLEIEDLAFGVPELGIDPFTIGSAQLALTFGAGGGLPGFAGLFSASSIALSPGVTLESVSIHFDSEPGSQGTILGAGGVVTPFVLSTSGSSACGADDVCLTVSGIGGAPLGGALTVRAGVDPGTDPPSSELLLDPAQLDLALLGAGLSGRIHGAGGIDEPFTFDTAGPWNAGFSLTTDLVVTDPFNGDAPVVRIESLSGDPVLTGTIAVTGTGFPAITANATADVRITLYPGQPQEASFPASAGEAQLVLQPDGSYSLALAAPALGQPGVFALAGGALTVSGSPSGVAVSLVGPQLTLFEGAPYQGTLTAGQCDLAADRFACSTEGSALTLPGLGAFDFAGDVALTPTSASGSIRSTGIAIPDDANVVALEPPVGRRDFGAAFTAGAGSLELTIAAPAVSLFGSPLPGAIPGVARIAFASDGSFALDFATARDFALLPDLVEFGAGAFSLTYSGGADPRIGFGFRSGLRLVALPPEADTDHLVDLPAFTLTGSCLLSSLAGGFQCPLDGTVDFAPPFDPVVGLGSFLQVVPSSATEIDFGRDVRGGVYVDARDLGVTLLGRDLGEFDASANTATGVFRLTASPPNLTLGAFVLDPIGSISIDLDFANGTAGASFPATRVRAPGVPQLPSGGVLFGGFALDPDGSFTTSASASLSWDGLSLGSAALTLTRRAGGVIGLEIAGATPPFDLGLVSVIPRSGSTIPLRVSVSSSGSASLSMGPARADLDAFGLETAVELYGASSSQPFSFSTTGPWSATIRSLGSVRFDPLGTGEVLRISPASAPLFQGSFSGNGLGAPSFSFSTTGSSTVTLFDGSTMDRVFTKGSGGVALSLTTGGRFRVSMSLPTIEYDNVFRLSSSSLLYEVDSGGFDFTVSSPTLTLFDDTSYLNTIVLPSCALSRSSFSCTSNGNSLSFPQIGSFSFSGSITLGASGFAFAASTGGLSFPSNGSLLAVGPGSASLSYTSSRVLSLSVTNPTATVLGQSFASNLVSGVSFTMQSNGSFTATLSTSSTRTLFGSSVLRMRSGGVTLTRSSSGALNLSASGELRIDHPNSSFNIVTTTRTFDLSIGTGTSSHTLASGLPSFDLGWFQVTPGNVVVTRSSSGVWSLAANDWDFELLGDSFPNVDFSIASNGSVDVDLGNRVFDIGGIRLDVNAGIPLDWDIDTGALSVPIPTQTNLIVTGISGLSGTLANGLDLIGFTIGTNGSFDMPALNRSLTLDGANFGSMAVDLRRSSATGSIIFEMTGDVNNSFFDADLDLEARSSGFFSFSLTGSAGFTQVCDCGFLQRCDPLCPFTGFDETPTLGGLDVDYLPTSSTPFQGTASLLGASFDVDFTGTTLSFCTAGICLDFTSPF